MRPTIYLAGPIRHAQTPVSWRAELRNMKGEFDWIDPMQRDVDPYEEPDRVVYGDLERISQSDGVFVGWHDEIAATGTSMEIRYASAELGIPVVIWRRDGGDRPLSPWLREHADYIADDSEAALWHLHGLCSAEGVPR